MSVMAVMLALPRQLNGGFSNKSEMRLSNFCNTEDCARDVALVRSHWSTCQLARWRRISRTSVVSMSMAA